VHLKTVHLKNVVISVKNAGGASVLIGLNKQLVTHCLSSKNTYERKTLPCEALSERLAGQ
jgi:hypothetical protein